MKLLYKPFGLIIGVLGGLAAGALFKRLWGALADEEEAPTATDRDRSWPEVVVASALKGAVFGAVKAASDRSGAAGFEHFTGTWPVKQSAKKKPK